MYNLFIFTFITLCLYMNCTICTLILLIIVIYTLSQPAQTKQSLIREIFNMGHTFFYEKYYCTNCQGKM